MSTSLASRNCRSSDLQLAVSSLSQKKDLMGYRNLLSYVSSLGVRVFPKSSLDPSSWEFIDSGSYSTTWKAPVLDGKKQYVALKQPNAPFTREEQKVEQYVQHEALSSMIQELRILADAKFKEHPSFPHVLGVFFQEEAPLGVRPCLIFDLAVSNLKTYLRTPSSPGIDARSMTTLCSQVANGICALHAYGLVHGDIKPENVLIFQREREINATVGDLGTCGVPSQSVMVPGTREFWAPEIHSKSPFHASMNGNPRDIYSFGLLVFSVLTHCKEYPFPENSQFNIQHDNERCWEYLSSRLPGDAVIGLQNVMQLCVKADPKARPEIFEICQKLGSTLGTTR
jgi:serine/threonine protein kinase